MTSGLGEGPGTFHLDEDDLRPVAGDKVDLPALAAPAPAGDDEAAALVERLDLILGGAAGVIGDRPPQPSAASFSAIW